MNEMTVRANGIDRKVQFDNLELNKAQKAMLRKAIRSSLEMIGVVGGRIEIPAMHERFGKITKVINWNRV